MNPDFMFGSVDSTSTRAKSETVSQLAASRNVSHIDRLPNELLERVMLALPLEDLMLAQAIHFWSQLIKNSLSCQRAMFLIPAPITMQWRETIDESGGWRLVRIPPSGEVHHTVHSSNSNSCWANDRGIPPDDYDLGPAGTLHAPRLATAITLNPLLLPLGAALSTSFELYQQQGHIRVGMDGLAPLLKQWREAPSIFGQMFLTQPPVTKLCYELTAKGWDALLPSCKSVEELTDIETVVHRELVRDEGIRARDLLWAIDGMLSTEAGEVMLEIMLHGYGIVTDEEAGMEVVASEQESEDRVDGVVEQEKEVGEDDDAE